MKPSVCRPALQRQHRPPVRHAAGPQARAFWPAGRPWVAAQTRYTRAASTVAPQVQLGKGRHLTFKGGSTRGPIHATRPNRAARPRPNHPTCAVTCHTARVLDVQWTLAVALPCPAATHPCPHPVHTGECARAARGTCPPAGLQASRQTQGRLECIRTVGLRRNTMCVD